MKYLEIYTAEKTEDPLQWKPEDAEAVEENICSWEDFSYFRLRRIGNAVKGNLHFKCNPNKNSKASLHR